MTAHNQSYHNQGNSRQGFHDSRNTEKFGIKFIDKFSDFKSSLTMNYFEEHLANDLKNIQSNSGLRNVYDTYLKILESNDFEIEFQVLLAKIAYQEQRKVGGKPLLPEGFSLFLRSIYQKLNDPKKFKQFLEVFVAYHKYFNPNSK